MSKRTERESIVTKRVLSILVLFRHENRLGIEPRRFDIHWCCKSIFLSWIAPINQRFDDRISKRSFWRVTWHTVSVLFCSIFENVQLFFSPSDQIYLSIHFLLTATIIVLIRLCQSSSLFLVKQTLSTYQINRQMICSVLSDQIIVPLWFSFRSNDMLFLTFIVPYNHRKSSFSLETWTREYHLTNLSKGAKRKKARLIVFCQRTELPFSSFFNWFRQIKYDEEHFSSSEHFRRWHSAKNKCSTGVFTAGGLSFSPYVFRLEILMICNEEKTVVGRQSDRKEKH